MENELKFNILFFKTKNKLDGNDWMKQSDADVEYERKLLKSTYTRAVNAVKKNPECYADQVKKIAAFFNFPEIFLIPLGFKKDGTVEKGNADQLERYKDDIISEFSGTVEADLDSDTAAAFFDDILCDDLSGWIPNDLIDTCVTNCGKVLKDNSLADDLMPNSTGVYDQDYLNEVQDMLTQMKHLKELNKKGFQIYAFFINQDLILDGIDIERKENNPN